MCQTPRGRTELLKSYSPCPRAADFNAPSLWIVAVSVDGHSSVAMTETHYAHFLKEDLVEASRAIKRPVAKTRGENVVTIRHRRG